MCLPGILLRDGAICEDCVGRVPWPGILHACYRKSRSASLALATSLTLHAKLGTFDDVELYIAISEFIRRKHIEAGILPQRVRVKPHFSWPLGRQERPGDYFLYLGRLSSEKGVRTLLQAWRGVNLRLLIVGDGPEASYLRSEAPQQVEFRPSLPAAEATALLRSARAVLIPSVSYEGAGRVVFEAYAAGVPVLASRVGGLPEYVKDGETGLLLPPGNPEAWARAVDRLMDHKQRERMANAGWNLWKTRYTPEHGLRGLVKAYEHAMLSSRQQRNTGGSSGRRERHAFYRGRVPERFA
jgi:glycosyltransferase involved in cell wall biosynthesis